MLDTFDKLRASRGSLSSPNEDDFMQNPLGPPLAYKVIPVIPPHLFTYRVRNAYTSAVPVALRFLMLANKQKTVIRKYYSLDGITFIIQASGYRAFVMIAPTALCGWFKRTSEYTSELHTIYVWIDGDAGVRIAEFDTTYSGGLPARYNRAGFVNNVPICIFENGYLNIDTGFVTDFLDYNIAEDIPQTAVDKTITWSYKARHIVGEMYTEGFLLQIPNNIDTALFFANGYRYLFHVTNDLSTSTYTQLTDTSYSYYPYVYASVYVGVDYRDSKIKLSYKHFVFNPYPTQVLRTHRYEIDATTVVDNIIMDEPTSADIPDASAWLIDNGHEWSIRHNGDYYAIHNSTKVSGDPSLNLPAGFLFNLEKIVVGVGMGVCLRKYTDELVVCEFVGEKNKYLYSFDDGATWVCEEEPYHALGTYGEGTRYDFLADGVYFRGDLVIICTWCEAGYQTGVYLVIRCFNTVSKTYAKADHYVGDCVPIYQIKDIDQIIGQNAYTNSII